MKKNPLALIAAKANSLSKAQSHTIKGGADIIGEDDIIMNIIVITDNSVG